MGDVTIQETIKWLEEKHNEYRDQAIKAEAELQRASKEYLVCVKRYYAYSTVYPMTPTMWKRFSRPSSKNTSWFTSYLSAHAATGILGFPGYLTQST